jgi:drug/metabolite transporter (DMT)-like permease
MPGGPRPTWIFPGLYAAMVLAWALNFLFVRIGVLFAPPLWLGVIRAVLGTAGVAVGLLLWRPSTPLTPTERRDAVLIGIPNTGLFFALWFDAAGQVPAGQTAILIYTFPLFVVILSPLLLSERATRSALPSVVIGFLGVFLVEQPWQGGSRSISWLAVAELLGASICWAMGTLLFKRRIRAPALRTANVYQLLGGTATLGVLALLLEPHPTITASASFIGAVLWLGLVGTAVAYVAWFALLERFPASTVSTWTLLTPVVAVIASILVFAEQVDLVQVVGMAAVLAGVFGATRTTTLEAGARYG